MSGTNDIHELREHLFGTLRALRDKTDPMEPDRARAVVQTAGALIDSVRVETEHLRVTGELQGTGFVGPKQEPPEKLPNGISSITRHALKG